MQQDNCKAITTAAAAAAELIFKPDEWATPHPHFDLGVCPPPPPPPPPPGLASFSTPPVTSLPRPPTHFVTPQTFTPCQWTYVDRFSTPSPLQATPKMEVSSVVDSLPLPHQRQPMFAP